MKIMTKAMKQEGKIVIEYVNVLQTLWPELNYYRIFEMNCTTYILILKKFIETDHVYEFLPGLYLILKKFIESRSCL